jgi:hypothetical protein
VTEVVVGLVALFVCGVAIGAGATYLGLDWYLRRRASRDF